MASSTRQNGVNWRQAGGEALLIFLGVGVALLGQAWWEYRGDREIEQHLLAGIRADLSRDTIDANRSIRAARDRIAGADRLLQQIQDSDAGAFHPVPWPVPGDGSQRMSEAFERALAEHDTAGVSPSQALQMIAATLSIQSLDLSDATFTEATASGQLNVIRDLELRALIADYYSTADRFSRTIDSRAEAQWQRFRQVLAESGLSAAGGEPSARILSVLGTDATLLAELKNLRDFAVGQASSHPLLLDQAETLISALEEALTP